MRLPPKPILLAARRWLELLPSSGGVPRAQALLTTHRQYSDLSPTQYATALNWLRDLALLDNVESPVPLGNRLLGAVFESAAPTWVQDADALVQSPQELPSDIIEAGSVLELDANGVYEQLVDSWGKVDTALRDRVGAAGETALVTLLRNLTSSQVDHVSLWSDGFGYDISFSHDAALAHLEVKSTTRTGRFTAYLSRHEYDVMLRDPRWVLITVRLTPCLEIAAVGAVARDWIVENTPRDVGASGSWASCKLDVPQDIIENRVSQLGCEAAYALPPWRPDIIGPNDYND